MRDRIQIFWAVFRLPLLLLLVIPFRSVIFTDIEKKFISHSELYFRYSSTIPLRLLLGLVFILLVITFFLVINTIYKKRGHFIDPFLATTILMVLLSAVLMILFSSCAYLYQVLILLILFIPINLMLSENHYLLWIQREPIHQLSNLFFSIVIIISEILLYRPFSLWLNQKTINQNYLKRNPYNVFDNPYIRIIYTAVICSLLLLFSFGTKQMIKLGAELFSDPSLQVITEGDYNGLELDLNNNTLFVSGHNTNHILAYDLSNLNQPPRESIPSTSYTQSFAFNPHNQEIYYYDQSTSKMVILDSNTLEFKESYKIPPLSPGDVWVAWDKHTSQIIIASEANNPRRDIPLILVDRQSGKFDQSLEQTSNILLDPDRPILYLAHFRLTNELRIFDLLKGRVIKSITTDTRSNRMALDPNRNELLIASPYKSAVLRYDKDTLEYKGKIKTMFSVRSLALDSARDLLLTGGLLTNVIDIIDLNSYRRIDRIYIGPWARTIVLDSENGDAYATTIEKVVKFHYAD